MKNMITLMFYGMMIFSSYGQELLNRQEQLEISSTRTYAKVTGILGAFPEEIKLLIKSLEGSKDTVIQQVHFNKGMLKGRPVVIAQTGIGKVNAAVTTILMIEHFHPHEIIFTGIAGSINPDLLPGDMVIGKVLAHHDYGTLLPEKFQRRPTRNPFTLKENPMYFKSDSMLLQLAQQTARSPLKFKTIKRAKGESTPKIITGVIVTGDAFISSDAFTKELRREMDADATEMEGASVAQVCWQQRQPFLVMRSISDNAGNSAYTDINNFYQIAAENSSIFMMELVSALKD